MEHSAHSHDLAVRPWRNATLIATAIAGLELVLLIVVGFVFVGKALLPGVESAAKREALAPEPKPAAVHRAPAAKPYKPPVAVAKLSRARTSVLVLNGNGIQGAAADAASIVSARGYPVKETGNAPRGDYARTLVMYAPGLRGEAERFARDLNVKVVTPLDGMKPAQLHGARLALIVGTSR